MKAKKIVCDCCHCQKATLRIVTGNGGIYIDNNGKVVWSDEPTVVKGTVLTEEFFNTLNVEDYFGSCPVCEDEAFVTIHFTDGTSTDDPEKAVKEILK